MNWIDTALSQMASGKAHVINDSKTPSGRVHVGSLRGVVIHDAIYKEALRKKLPVEFIYGSDDMDPLDGLPENASEELKQQMGKPLYQIASPESGFASFADYYMAEFLEVFAKLGVEAKIYRMHEIYQSGLFNEAIDGILKHAELIRSIYWEVSKSKRAENWYPFQVVCEACGKIGSTETVSYNGKEVEYVCLPDKVTWAKGCSHRGKISPFDGNGKLPWKLEWVAKWFSQGVSFEGAGKDHSTKGGSRDVAEQILKKVFGQEPPINLPYEFFLVEGSKMSSSKGVGSTAKEIADFLPPEILRFLMLRQKPLKTVNFSTANDYIVKLFNEFDQLHQAQNSGSISDEHRSILRQSWIREDAAASKPLESFQLLAALRQLPHINVIEELKKRHGSHTDEVYWHNMHSRIEAVDRWREQFAAPEDLLTLQQTLPESASSLSHAQKGFLLKLASFLSELDQELDQESYQSLIFKAARLTPLEPSQSF